MISLDEIFHDNYINENVLTENEMKLPFKFKTHRERATEVLCLIDKTNLMLYDFGLVAGLKLKTPQRIFMLMERFKIGYSLNDDCTMTVDLSLIFNSSDIVLESLHHSLYEIVKDYGFSEIPNIDYILDEVELWLMTNGWR